MITDDDVLEYLSHHGVAGMKWGHRKAAPPPISTGRRPAAPSAKPVKKTRTQEQQARRQAKIKAGVAVGKLALASAALVGGIIVANRQMKMNEVTRQAQLYNQRTDMKRSLMSAQVMQTRMSMVGQPGYRVGGGSSVIRELGRGVGR